MRATSLEMIQQKHAFLIETESVRRMLYAKPSMIAAVVQLLVDLSVNQFGWNKIADSDAEKLCRIDHHNFYISRQDSGKGQPLSRLSPIVFAYSKQLYVFSELA